MNDKELEEVELLKKLKDPMFYLENFCSVKSKVQGIVPFKLKEAQKDLFNTVNKYDRVMILKARQLGMCGHPSMKVLTSDLRWITLRDIKEGQKIVSVDEFPEKGRGKGRKLRLAIVEKKIIVNEIAYKVKMDNGVELIFTGEHRFLSKKWNNCSTVIWKKVKNFKVGDVVRYITNTWDENLSFEDGWFSGMLDGEGSFAKKSRNGSSLNVAQVEGPVWERLKKYVEEKKYSYRIEWDKRKSGLSSKFGDKIVGKIVLSRMDELFEILGRCRPTRFIERDWWTGKDIPGKKSGIGWSTIISIEQLERQEMIDLQTSTKTYIVEGFISHNSTAMVGWIYHNTIMNPGTNSAIIGYNQSLTQELFDIVKILLRSTPDALRPTVDYNTKDQITFPKLDSKIIVLPSTVNVGRGFKLNNVLCVSGDTKVFGRNGFVKNVKDVLPGEFIVNGSGGLSKVKDVIKKKNDKRIIRTKIIGTEDLITTEDHKILTRRKNDVGTGRTLEWKKAKDITKKDYIGYPFFYIRNRFKTVNIDEIVNSNYKSRSVKHESVIDINYDFGVFCGWFLAEGSISNSTISLSINKNEVEEVLAVVKKVERYAGKVGVYLSKTSKTAIIHLYGKNFSAFLEKYFGNGCLNKTINDSCWYWGSQFGYGLIYGLLQGDGYLKNDRKIQLTSVSPQLIYQTKKLFVSLRLGLPNVTHKESYRYGVKGLDRYDLTMAGKGNYKTRRKLGLPLPVFDNGWARWLLENAPTTNQGHGRWRRGTRHYWASVKDVSVEENFKDEFVYDIVLEKEPHSFLTTSGVVHNCTELSSWENAEEKMMTLEASVPITGKIVVESCVTGDTIVFTNKGPRYVRSIHDWKNNNLGFSKGKEIKLDGHYGLKPTNTYYNSGIKKGFRVKTIDGNLIGMSAIHKMYVLRGAELEFVKAEDLIIGDKIAIKYGQELWGNNNKIDWEPTPYSAKNKKWIKLFSPSEITKDLAYLIGLILGDGYVDFKRGRVVITTIDKDVSDFLSNNSLGLRFTNIEGINSYHYNCKNNSFVEFLEKFIGFKAVKAPKKEIPEKVFEWGRDNVVALLQGLFDADGSCHGKRNSVSFVSTSKILIDQIRVLLLNFGIVSKTYSCTSAPTERVKVWSHPFTLEINIGNSWIFSKKIGFRINRKNEKLPKENKSLGKTIPGLGKIIKENIKELDLKYLRTNISNKSFYSETGNIKYLTLKKILDKCKNKNSSIYKKILKLYELNYYYDEVKEIVPIEENVYDFTVEDGHTVVYNGMVGHQTPKGIGGLYSRMWHSKNDYVKKKYEWWWEYTRDEIEIIKRRMNSPMRFAQEYGLEFLTSGRAVFSPEIIREIQKSIKDVGEEIIDLDEKVHTVHVEDFLRIYKEPVAGKKYVAGCLPDGEKVLTDSGIKNIENINFSDKLVDINGKNTDIKNIQRRYYEGDIVEIKPNYTSISTKFTSEHLISVLENNKIKRVCKRLGGKRYYEETVKWKKAKDITDKDIVKVPIRFTFSISNSEIISHFPNQDHIRIDRRIDPSVILKEDFWFFMGLWLAEGWTRLDKLGHNSIVMHLNGYTEHDLAKRVKVICKKLFNRSLSITHRKDRQNVFDLKISSEVIYEFIINNFGQKAKNKDIKEWIKYLPNNLKLALFEGYRTGDGCEIIMKQGLKINCVSISEKLLYDFQEILLSVGILSSVTVLREAGYHFIVKKEYYCQKTFELNISVRDSDKILKNDVKFSRERHKVYGWIKDGFVYAKIAKIKKSYFKGYVNNFETKTHSYQSPFIVTHNCDISEGVEGGDYSVVTIWDRETGEEVAMFRGHLPADRMGDKLNVWGRKYNNAFMVVEINNHGLTTIKALEKHLYPSMYYRPSKLDHGGVTFTSRQGWRTTTVTKPLMTDDFAQACREKVLLIHSRELLNEMSMYVYADNGDMTCGSGMHDDCFVKDTMILTDKGNVAIQDIKIGDLVMTRNGYRPVEFTRNRKKKVIKNIGLTGTPSHKIIIVEGKKELDSVRDYDKLHIWNTQKQKIEKLSYMEARNIIDTQNQIGVNYDRTTGDTINGKNHLLHYIGRFGLIILDQYQKVLLFIIKIMTRWTTLLKTWKRKAEVNIQKTTWMNQKEKNFRVLLLKNKEQDYMKQVQNGEKLQKELSLIEKIYLFLYSKLKGLLFVVFVKNLLSLGYTMLNIVLILVEIFTGTIELSQKRRVYNLQVYDTHEYFANNILVSNCIMSACIGLQGFKMMAPKPLTQIDYTSHMPSSFAY